MRLDETRTEGWKVLERKRWVFIAVFFAAVVATVVGIWAVGRKNEAQGEREGAISSEGSKSEVERKWRRNIFCEMRDEKAPEITPQGVITRTVAVGEKYELEGARAIDECDGEVRVEVEGEVDVNTAGTYEIKYIAQDRAGNESVLLRTVRVVDPSNGERVVYLTFDDGPSEYTGKLLDVLEKYGVKATFFVTGYGDDALIRREFDEGHTVALHTYSHRYDVVYASEAAYFEDLYAVRDRVKQITGMEPKLIRFPGGSSNMISAYYNDGIMSRLVGEVEARGFRYVDWNVSSGDAGGAKTANEVFEITTSTLKEGVSIVLQHDTKEFSVEAVERIIKYGMENGYTFLPMTEESEFLAHHGVNN